MKIYDADRIKDSKNIILNKIIQRENFIVLHGPAGCGKTTLAQRIAGNNFVENDQDITDTVLVLSGASKTKSGDMSPALKTIISKAKKVMVMVPSNFQIINRRVDRARIGANDLRNKQQLKGTISAPCRQFDLISKMKKIAKNFEIIQ